MAGPMESLQTLNSVVRTILALVVVGGGGMAAWKGYANYYAKEDATKQLQSTQQELTETRADLEKRSKELKAQAAELKAKNAAIVTLEADVKRKSEEIMKLDTALRLLKVDHRLARISILDQSRDADSGIVSTLIEFVELNDEGFPIDEPRQFRVRGEVVYVDNWVVKFDDKYIEQSDLDRATSLVLFRRIFGEQQEPQDGSLLDDTNRPPRAYTRGGVISEFEQRIWDDFWNIANDESRARELGIRAAHGEAISIRAEKGRSYRIQLRASDGLSIVPEASRTR